MPEIEDWGVTVEEYLAAMAEGIDILEVRRLEAQGIPTHLAIEVIEIHQKVVNKTATAEEIVRGLMILTPSLRDKLDDQQEKTDDTETSSSQSPCS